MNDLNFNNARKQVDEVYRNLSEISDSTVKTLTKELDNEIDRLSANLHNLSNEQIRMTMSKLSVSLYYILTIKDSSDLKRQCSDLLLKEKQAKLFSTSQGTQEAKKSYSLLASNNEQLSNMLYETVYNRLRSKIEGSYKIIDTLKNVLISRQAEAKLNKIQILTEEEQ